MLDDKMTCRRRRHRRRGRATKKRFMEMATDETTWWQFAPHPTDERGEVLTINEIGFPVLLPSGQSVFLLHSAANPARAATFLAESALRGERVCSANSSTDEPGTSCDESSSAEDFVEKSKSLPAHKHFEAAIRRPRRSTADPDATDLWDDVDDGARSTCSDLTADDSDSPPAFFSSAVGDSSDAGSDDASGTTASASSCESGRSLTNAALTWQASFHNCLGNLPSQIAFEPAALTALARALVKQPCSSREPDQALWGGSCVAASTFGRSSRAEVFSVFEFDPLPELEAAERAEEEAFAVAHASRVDALTGAPSSEPIVSSPPALEASKTPPAEAAAEVSNPSQTRKLSPAEKREEKRRLKQEAAEEQARQLKAARRRQHEARVRRNQAKLERRLSSAGSSAEVEEEIDEIDAALRELGLLV